MSLLVFILALGMVAGLALLCGLVSNVLFPGRSPKRRAAVAAGVTGVLAIAPICLALWFDGASLAQIVPMLTAVVLLAALSFPIALTVTRRQPGPADPKTFD